MSMARQLSDCAHGNIAGVCWHCLTPAERAESQQIWSQLESIPELQTGMLQAKQEIEQGRVIEIRRPEQKGRTIVFPYSTFWKMVDYIHDDRMAREDD
jgi:hypothetical protein